MARQTHSLPARARSRSGTRAGYLLMLGGLAALTSCVCGTYRSITTAGDLTGTQVVSPPSSPHTGRVLELTIGNDDPGEGSAFGDGWDEVILRMSTSIPSDSVTVVHLHQGRSASQRWPAICEL